MISLESDKMTVLLTNYSLTLTLYETFSNSMPKMNIFSQTIFLIQGLALKVTKWLLCDEMTA